jgi:hypothetical protein
MTVKIKVATQAGYETKPWSDEPLTAKTKPPPKRAHPGPPVRGCVAPGLGVTRVTRAVSRRSPIGVVRPRVGVRRRPRSRPMPVTTGVREVTAGAPYHSAASGTPSRHMDTTEPRMPRGTGYAAGAALSSRGSAGRPRARRMSSMSSGCCPLISAGRSWTRSQAVAIKNIASIFGITAEEPANSRTQPMRLFFKGKLGVRSWRKADEAPKRAGSPPATMDPIVAEVAGHPLLVKASAANATECRLVPSPARAPGTCVARGRSRARNDAMTSVEPPERLPASGLVTTADRSSAQRPGKLRGD